MLGKSGSDPSLAVESFRLPVVFGGDADIEGGGGGDRGAEGDRSCFTVEAALALPLRVVVVDVDAARLEVVEVADFLDPALEALFIAASILSSIHFQTKLGRTRFPMCFPRLFLFPFLHDIRCHIALLHPAIPPRLPSLGVLSSPLNLVFVALLCDNSQNLPQILFVARLHHEL